MTRRSAAGGSGPDRAGSSGQLLVCGTPIGNLDDVTPRLRATLGAVDAIACEDTRTTRQLLSALGVSAPRLVSYRDDNEADAARRVLAELEAGRDVALVTDAGMPGVSDPGAVLVQAAHDAGVEVRVIPGPSAVDAAVAVSGCGGSGYVFVAFLPRSARELCDLVREHAGEVVVAFESPRRLPRSLEIVAGIQPDRRGCVARELTKRFEQVACGSVRDLAARVGEDGDVPARGEFVVVLDRLPGDAAAVSVRAVDLVLAMVDEGVRMKDACRLVAAHDGVPTRELYERARVRRDELQQG